MPKSECARDNTPNVDSFLNRGRGGISMRGIICPPPSLVWIRLPDLSKFGGARAPQDPSLTMPLNTHGSRITMGLNLFWRSKLFTSAFKRWAHWYLKAYKNWKMTGEAVANKKTIMYKILTKLHNGVRSDLFVPSNWWFASAGDQQEKRNRLMQLWS